MRSEINRFSIGKCLCVIFQAHLPVGFWVCLKLTSVSHDSLPFSFTTYIIIILRYVCTLNHNILNKLYLGNDSQPFAFDQFHQNCSIRLITRKEQLCYHFLCCFYDTNAALWPKSYSLKVTPTLGLCAMKSNDEPSINPAHRLEAPICLCIIFIN